MNALLKKFWAVPALLLVLGAGSVALANSGCCPQGPCCAQAAPCCK